jgi:hypothetical protein
VTPFNPPRLQNGPVVWALFCLFGFVFSVWLLFRYSFGTDSWYAALLVMGIVMVGFVAVEGWWAVSQREVRVEANTILIRRWVELLLGRAGMTLALGDITEARLVLRGGKMLELVTDGKTVRFWVALWAASDLRGLMETFRDRNVKVEMEWSP